MSRFIKTTSGYINQDHILLIRFGVEKEEGEDLIQMSDGRIIQTQIMDFAWLGPEGQNRSMPMPPAIEPEPEPEPEPELENRSMPTPPAVEAKPA
jgi:hypothetical protein